MCIRGTQRDNVAGRLSMGSLLSPGTSVNLQFVIGIEQDGNFRFLVIDEALP